MTTATAGVAVVATRLPLTDRRSLSQAWYSALHVAERDRSARPAAPHRAACAAPGSPPAPPRGETHGAPVARVAPAATPGLAGAERTIRSTAPAALERRAPHTEITRRIERALLRRTADARPATVAVIAGGGRVQLLVRTDRDATRIIALCRPDLRAPVERALAHVRFALMASGVQVAVDER